MDLERLYEFVIIAQNKSIKKAAEKLSVFPATLYSRFRTFESALGVTLFQNNQGELNLTVKGLRFYTDAFEIIKEYQQLKRDVSISESFTFHELRIAVSGHGLPFYLGPFLDMLNVSNPQMQLELLDDSRYSIVEGLLTDRLDLYFAPVMNQFTAEGIVRYTIAPSQQYVLLPSAHRLAFRAGISLRELDRECFILYPQTKETCIRDYQLRNLKASGIRYTVYDSPSAVAFNHLMVPIGKGLVISPIPIMNEIPNTTCILLTDLQYPAASSLFYRRDCSNPEVIQFVKYFRQFIRETQSHENRVSL